MATNEKVEIMSSSNVERRVLGLSCLHIIVLQANRACHYKGNEREVGTNVKLECGATRVRVISTVYWTLPLTLERGIGHRLVCRQPTGYHVQPLEDASEVTVDLLYE